MADFGFVGASYLAQSITQDAQDCVNWYPEIDPAKEQGERGVVALYPTPGFVAQVYFGNGATSGQIRAMHVFPGGNLLFCVVGSTLWEVNSAFLGTVRATLNTQTGPCSITDNGVYVYIVDGANRYSWNTTTFTFTQLSPTPVGGTADGPFNGGSRCDQVDGYIVYAIPNSQDWCATSLGSNLTPNLSFGVKNSASDNIVSIIVSKREVFILGEKSSEVWVDAGTFPFPFQKLPGANMQHGCIAAQSVSLAGESFMFLGQDDRGKGQVFIMEGYAAKNVATQAIQNELLTYATLTDAIGMTYQQNGHEFYVLTFPTADKTWCYDLTTGLWHRRAIRTNDNVLHRDHSQSMAYFQGLNLSGDKSTGFIYSLSTTHYTDYSDSVANDTGNLIPRIRRCRHLTNDLNRTIFHDFQIQFQPGVGKSSGQGSDPQAMLRWSDDGGFTWSNEHWTSIGKIGKYNNRAIWRRLGASRDRIFEVQVSDPVFPVIVSAELRTSAGAA